MNKETISPDWKEMYKQLEHSHRVQLEEIEHEFRNKLDSERNTKNIIIERQEEEIKFYKNIIKEILHIK